MAGNRMVSHTIATYCKYFLSCVFEAVTMALAIVVCNAFINAGLPAFTGSYADWAQTLIYPVSYTHLKKRKLWLPSKEKRWWNLNSDLQKEDLRQGIDVYKRQIWKCTDNLWTGNQPRFSHISVTGKHLPTHTGQTVGKVWTYSRYSCKVRRWYGNHLQE